MLWVRKEHKTYVKSDGLENINNFTLKIFAYLNLCDVDDDVLDENGNFSRYSLYKQIYKTLYRLLTAICLD